MKKTIFILIALFSLSNNFAQVNLKIGANIGGQISSLRGLEFETENNFEIVPTLGLNIEVAFNQSISLITAINFERWKKKRETYYFEPLNNSGRYSTVKEGYSFFNIPLLVRYKLGDKKKYFIDGGGFVNYFNTAKPNGFIPLFISFEDYNFGLSLGFGTIFYLNDRTDITLQLRNELGLTDVNKYKTMLNGNVKTNTIRLIATFNFKL